MYSIDELIDIIAERSETLEGYELDVNESITEYLLQYKFICSI